MQQHCRNLSLATRWAYCAVVASAFASFLGCGSGGGASGEMPAVDPGAAATKAIELYDKDASGSLNQAELAASPGLLAALARYDTDSNREVSKEEIGARMKAMFSSSAPWVAVNCQLLRSGRPLSGATVRFVPEPFLADYLQPATGTTDAEGYVNPAVAEEHRPEDQKAVSIMQPGVYRVEVEHASVKAPHKPLGCEIDYLVRGGIAPVLQL
jgi:hypothetical protein